MNLEDLEDYRRELQEWRARLDRGFEELAGDDLPAILSNKAVAETYMTHPDRSRRIVAVWALASRWPHDEKTAELFTEAARCDEDIEVRAMAASELGSIFSSISDVKTGRFLAALAFDENEEPRVREGAYRGLFHLAGIPPYGQPDLIDFDLLRDADWEFVKSFLERSGMEEREAESDSYDLPDAVVFECRPVSAIRWVAAQGYGLFGAYVVLPLVVIPFVALLATSGVLRLVAAGPQWLRIVAPLATFVLCYGVLFWLSYFHPRGDYLVLHPRGFRVKITFRQHVVLFDDLETISFGLDSAVFRLSRGISGSLRLGQGTFVDELASTALNVHFKDGTQKVFKQFLARFEPEDTQRFLDYIGQHHGRLLQKESA